MYYSYYVDPLSNYAAGDYSYDSTSTHCNNWSTPITIFDSGIGEYCKVVADVNGGIHIAAYDSSNGDVDYAYLSSYSDTSAETCVVDSYGIIGTELTLDVALNSDGNPVPYIGYYASSSVRPKIAYKVTTSSNNPAGATDDVYTQNWEISLVPTSSKLIEDHINVGVWKSSGVLTNSYITGTTVGTTSCTATGSSYTASNYGTIYGNGTSNPFMGYAIKSGSSGYIETAQMK